MTAGPFPLTPQPFSRPNRLRFALNTGTCGLALGGGASYRRLHELAEASKGRFDVVEAGCDGACFEAPSLRVMVDSQPAHRLAAGRDGQAGIGSLIERLSAKADPLDLLSSALGPPEQEPFSGQRRRLLANCGVVDPTSIDSAIERGAYRGFWLALSELSPEQVIDQVEASELRGRGGAYFPTGHKWRSARGFRAPRYLVVNAEEGEPGVFKDRHLMEGDPHLLLEGVLIAAYAAGASRGFVFINGLAFGSRRRMETAVEQARRRGLIGEHILGSDFSFEVELRSGAGGYVLGEESVLLNGIEGQRPVPRTRPPFPVEAGLWASPTVINNVETLCNVPYILREGVERFREGAGPNGAGTKLISLSGAVRRPGLVEVDMGTSIQGIVFGIGGGAPEGKRIIGVLAGGPSGGLLAVENLDTPARPGPLASSGAVLGSGGLVVLDDSLPVVEIVRHLTEYNRNESCSKCTPCREGTDRMLEILGLAGRREAGPTDLERLSFFCDVAAGASLCGLGQMAPNPITSALDQFSGEFRAAFRRERA